MRFGIVDLVGGDQARDGAFDATDHENLEGLEERSFWFRARNDLICWSLQELCPRGHNLLEVGCGNGFVLAGIQRVMPQLELSGGELGSHGLRVARERLAEAFLYELDARALPFRDEFDVVCAFDVLEHIDEDVGVMEQMRLAGTPGALILLSVPQHRHLWSSADDYAGHKRRYSRSELVGKLAEAGLAPELVTSFASAVLPLMMASRIRTRLARSTYDPTQEHRQAQRSDVLLNRLMSIDLRLIRAGHSLPVGGSLFVAARPSA